MPDDDNVIPFLDGDWFTDDISQRFREFLKVTFGTEHYDENLTFLENALYPDNLTGKKRKTIRDYFLKEFYNHHVKLYKKRPIYWLFSSPKGTFNALIYMHRYRPDTVSVVLSYLRDFRDKLTHHTAHLQSVADRADGSKSDKTKALKQINEFKKQLKELDDYERTTLFPLAQKQIPIDLDDGVKVNYPKFGAALKDPRPGKERGLICLSCFLCQTMKMLLRHSVAVELFLKMYLAVNVPQFLHTSIIRAVLGQLNSRRAVDLIRSDAIERFMPYENMFNDLVLNLELWEEKHLGS
ncbi:MAG: hypothetical protein R3C09_25080 [Pirellulaceae bacterium]